MGSTSQIVVRDLTLEYRVRTARRLVPNIRRRGEVAANEGIGGSLLLRGDRQAIRSLDKVSFALNAGDRVALLGKNGAGKTSLLSVLAGVYPPTSGTVQITGSVDALFNISLGFRQDATGRRNIILRGLIAGWSTEQIKDRIPEIIEFSELGHFIDMPYRSYSQGMAARLAFSIATAVSPNILLLDEWIGAGDADFQKKARDRMNRLIESAGILVIASHNKSLLKDVCNKGMILSQGEIVAQGSIDEILVQ